MKTQLSSSVARELLLLLPCETNAIGDSEIENLSKCSCSHSRRITGLLPNIQERFYTQSSPSFWFMSSMAIHIRRLNNVINSSKSIFNPIHWKSYIQVSEALLPDKFISPFTNRRDFSACSAGVTGHINSAECGENITTNQQKDYMWKTSNFAMVVPGFGHGVLRQTYPINMCQREFSMKNLPDNPFFQLVNT
ncbi:hypothetical protein LXL04_029781 [Taraxacum kok-saghyz]